MPVADRRRRLPPFLIAIAVVVGLVGTACGDDGSAAGLRGIVRTPAPDVSGLSLPDVTADGAEFVFEAADGEVLLVYFGYTSCPDVCPLTLSRVARAIEGLGDRGDEVQVLMVSVDPARDTLDVLGEYLRNFDERFVGVGGDMASVANMAASYGVFFEAQPPDDDGFYEVDHTSTLLGIDRQGNLKVIWNPDVEADPLRSDIEELLS